MAESSGTPDPADVFQELFADISPLIGRHFTNVTNGLFGKRIITRQEISRIESQPNLNDGQRGTKVAFLLYDKISESDDPVQCLLKICGVFESGAVNDASLKKHGTNMRSKFATRVSPATPVETIATVQPPRASGDSASSRFRSVSDRLASAITPSLIRVAGKLYAAGLIGHVLNDEMINGRDIDSKKAVKLVNELQRALDNDVNPEQYLNDICRVLRDIGERQITDIVNILSTATSTVATSQATPHTVPHHEGYSRPGPTYPPGPVQGELNINHMDWILEVLNKAMFGPVNWRSLGLKLGLYITTLNVVSHTNGNANDYLMQTIQEWLEKKDDVKETTWPILIDAVKRTGDNAAAQRMPAIITKKQQI